MSTSKLRLYSIDTPVGLLHEAVLATSAEDALADLGERMRGRGITSHMAVCIGTMERDDLLELLLPKMTTLDNPLTAIAALDYVAAEYPCLSANDRTALRRIRGRIFDSFS